MCLQRVLKAGMLLVTMAWMAGCTSYKLEYDRMTGK
jgi:hypothetical protein